MGCRITIARVIALGAALAIFGTGAARAKDPSEFLQQDLIVRRVERGAFPNVRLWVTPIESESMPVSDDAPPRVYEIIPDFLRAANGTIANLKHPRNVRNMGAYYLEPGDKVFCSRATYDAKSKRWVLDGLQRIVEQRASKMVRGRRKLEKDPLEVEMIADKKVYTVGEPIRLTLRAKNPTAKPIELVFPSGETHALSVFAGFNEVWRIATIDQQTPESKKVLLKPGQSIEFVEVWDQKTSEGKPAEAGRYFASGKVISEGRAILPDSRAPFRIKAADGQQTSADTAAPSN
jgi:hypothetical protein